ncbi:MAG: CPBP family intramembrane metalloprotease [Phycisphaerae bacterium]|nr:CPBP family intramembrane metalloprotease [Phycisphaerae bacterium]
MSPVLFSLAGAEAPADANAQVVLSEAASYTQCALIIFGTILLLIWCARRVFRPGKLSLSDTPGRPNTLTALHVIGAFLFWQLAGEAARYLLELTPLDETYVPLLSGVIRQTACLPVLLVVGHLTFRHGLQRGLGLSMRHWAFDALRGLYAAMAVFPVCIGLAKLFGWLTALLRPEWVQPHSLLVTLREASPAWGVVVTLSAVVLAPLVEELLFRGLLQSMLRRYLNNPWHATLLTAGIFALFHIFTPQNVPALFVLGLVLGYNYERCGRLGPVVLIHALFNGIMVLLNVI